MNLTELMIAEQQNPNNAEILSELALYYIHQPSEDKDLDYLKRAVEVDANSTTLHNLAFWLHHEYGENEQAEYYYRQALKLEHKAFYSYTGLAEILLSKKPFSPQEIIPLYQKALILFKNAPLLYQTFHRVELVYIKNNLANLLAINGQYQDAMRYFAEIELHLKNNIEDQNFNQNQIDEIGYQTQCNRILTLILKQNLQQAQQDIIALRQHDMADPLNLATLAVFNQDLDLALQIISAVYVEQEILQIDWSWQSIWFMLANKMPLLWQQKYQLQQSEIQQDLNEATDQSERQYFQTKLKQLQQHQNIFPTQDKIIQHYHYFYHCWLFNCATHRNLKNHFNHWFYSLS